MNYRARIAGLAVLLLLVLVNLVIAQSDGKVQRTCGQTREERVPLINEAFTSVFTVRRVSFAGNTYTRDRDFRERKRTLNEGDIFTPEALETSVKRLSKMRSIRPIRMDDIEVTLDRPRKDIDITFCIRQRPKH